MGSPDPPSLSLPDMLDRMDQEMRLRGYSHKTRSLYRGHVERFYRTRDPGNLRCTEEECREWLLSLLDRGLSHSYMTQALSALKFLHRNVLHDSAPVARIPRARDGRYLPTVLSREETRRLIDRVRNPKHRALVLLLYSAGLRVGEVVRLRVEDIDSDRRLIKVRDGKGRKDRYVMLADVALEALRTHWHIEPSRHWLFRGDRRDRHLHVRTVQRVVARAASKAGIQKKVTPHTLRHSFATHLHEAGSDIRFIQRLLGHKKSTTTEIYTRVADRDLAKIQSPADALLKPSSPESPNPGSENAERGRSRR